jgi:hypothetical protein
MGGAASVQRCVIALGPLPARPLGTSRELSVFSRRYFLLVE